MNNSVNEPDSAQATRRALSGLMDGDRGAGDAVAVFAAWNHDAESRSVWHAYHLIGDVLRSEDLASTPAQDEAFLKSLRARLALESVPLSPAPLRRVDGFASLAATSSEPAAVPAAVSVAALRRSSRWWMAPAAVAAGFVAAAGLLVATQGLSPDAADRARLAQAKASAAGGPVRLAVGEMARNAGLDRYLVAHRSLANGLVASGGADHRVQILFEIK